MHWNNNTSLLQFGAFDRIVAGIHYVLIEIDKGERLVVEDG